ncbi:MAG TPA: nucleotide exchange factor GrpE [Anaerolineales bacterium]|jgi:molecular chaperone GrpE
MTDDEEKESQNEDTSETSAEAVAADQSDPMAALIARLEEAEVRAAEYKDGWQRAQAEFQNYKKRLDRDNEAVYASMKSDILKRTLPVLDDLERALQNRPADEAWVGGIELITHKLRSILEAEGVKRIEAEGKMFDPNLHEAITHEPSDEVKSGCVIAVAQNGYMLGERVLRPALVRVAQ